MTDERLSAYVPGEELHEALCAYHWPHFAARVLQTANALGVFARLADGPRAARELAADAGAHAGKLEALLDACCAMRLLEKSGTRYFLTRLAEETLVPGARFYQGDILRHFYDLWDLMGELPEAVVRGSFTRNPFGRTEPWQSREVFVRGMRNLAMGGQARRLVELVPLRGKRRLLDVGGGPGTYAICFCERNPALAAEIFDLPDAIAIAREYVAAAGLADRIALREGDWFVDDFGEGFDAILMSEVLHGPDSSPQLKLGKARRALARGGLLIVADFVLREDGTGPLEAALFNLVVGAFKIDALLAEIRKAGFGNPTLRWHEKGQGIVTAGG
jgi:hypothetical protein